MSGLPAGPILQQIKSFQYSFESESFNSLLTKMSWIVILLPLLLKCVSSISVIERFDSIAPLDDQIGVKNDEPIIGVMVQESLAPHIKYKTYIAASYIKFVEGSGARAVPIW